MSVMNEPFEYEDAPLETEGATALAPAPLGEDDVADPYDASPGFADQPVPRISVAAFCEMPGTMKMVEEAGADRRMARAHVTVQEGGLPAAIERYYDEATPNLIIIESGMRGRTLFAQLDELANVCDPHTKVIVIGAANDIALYRELMRRGVSEYLVPPLSSVQLMRAIAALYLDPDQPFHGRAVAFVGAKGGVGSSTLAHNVAWCVSEYAEVDATIVDLDLSFGTAGLDFNQDPMQGVAEALSQPERVDDVLLDRLVTRCTDRLTLFTAPATLEREWELSTDAYATVIEAVRKTVPLVVLDLPHVWAPWMRETLLGADDVVITATPDLASLRNAKNIFDLVRSARPNDPAPKVVLNQVGVPKRPEIPVKDFAEALGAEPALVLPFEPQIFGAAANNGQMIPEVKLDAKAAEGVQMLAMSLMGREAPARAASFVDKLLKRK